MTTYKDVKKSYDNAYGSLNTNKAFYEIDAIVFNCRTQLTWMAGYKKAIADVAQVIGVSDSFDACTYESEDGYSGFGNCPQNLLGKCGHGVDREQRIECLYKWLNEKLGVTE
ncbi:MAG: hypothetical protein FWH42_01395 [Dehalococcoidia bacterium]|nr:hypothetical protein [Dehalococcoidia bacterium]